MDVERSAVGPSFKVPVVCLGEAAGSFCVFFHILDRGIRPAGACPQPRPNLMNQLVAEYFRERMQTNRIHPPTRRPRLGWLNVFTPTV
jgi:hypothetical protein